MKSTRIIKACSYCGALILSTEGIKSPKKKHKGMLFCNKQHLEKFEEGNK